MSIYRIKKEANEDNEEEYEYDVKTKITEYFDNNPDGMIILEKGVHISTDKYIILFFLSHKNNIKFIDEKGEKYITLGRRERNKTYKRQRVNVGLLHVIDYRVDNILNIIKIMNIMIVVNVILGFINIWKI